MANCSRKSKVSFGPCRDTTFNSQSNWVNEIYIWSYIVLLLTLFFGDILMIKLFVACYQEPAKFQSKKLSLHSYPFQTTAIPDDAAYRALARWCRCPQPRKVISRPNTFFNLPALSSYQSAAANLTTHSNVLPHGAVRALRNKKDKHITSVATLPQIVWFLMRLQSAVHSVVVRNHIFHSSKKNFQTLHGGDFPYTCNVALIQQ